jgi:hypothetical protein
MWIWRDAVGLVALALRVLYIAFPVMLAAAVHIVVIRRDLLPWLRVPIDGGATLRGRRILGDNKTWRGAVVMVGVSALGMALQQRYRIPSLEMFDYGAIHAWLWGAALGLGFVLAELPNSFLKRQCGVEPGRQATGAQYWLFTSLDQVDSVAGGLACLALFWIPPWRVVIAALVFCSLAHIAFNVVFVWVGLKRRAL